MRERVFIEGKTPQEFVDAYNEVTAEISRFTIIEEKWLTDTSEYLTYEIPNDVEEAAGDVIGCNGRFCAECDNYDWGKKCLAGIQKLVRPTTPACEYFNEEIGGVQS